MRSETSASSFDLRPIVAAVRRPLMKRYRLVGGRVCPLWQEVQRPLSTLRVLPHGRDPRMTRGQCGSLLLHCNGLSPSTSCRSSRRTAAQWLAYAPPCQRFAETLAGNCATLSSGRIEARTGLRMMPTFPRSPLSFRTAGFPRYGWKAGFSNGAFLTSTPA